MTVGESVAIWSVRVALIGYAIGAVVVCLQYVQPTVHAGGRLAWSLGCAFFIVHVIAAMGAFHGWSHEAAYVYTAERTRDLVGIETGTGLYLNYLFTLVWIIDVALWWRRGNAHIAQRSASIMATHAFMLFMVINATIVFASGIARWMGVAITLAIVIAFIVGRRRVLTNPGD